jgi:hypothetical protein
MRCLLLLVLVGGCGTLVAPAAGPDPREPRPAGGSLVQEPAPPMTARQVDPRQPRAACDDKGAAVSEWPDTLVRIADAVR